METRDWSLVFFTVLTQAAVGAFLVLQVLRYLSHRQRAPRGTRTADEGPSARRPADGARHDGPEAGNAGDVGREAALSLLIVLAVLSAGLFAALFHLSTPLQAARAIVNFSSSWLSREIVFGSLFAALLGMLVWREWRAADAVPANPLLVAWLPRLAAAAGLTFLGCQVAIYLLPAQPAWNSFATPAAFAGTALRLGILGVTAGLVVQKATDRPDDPMRTGRVSPAVLRGLAAAGIAALALEFAIVPLHLAALAADGTSAAAASAQRLSGDYGGVLLLRLGLLAAAAAALGGVLAVAREPVRAPRRRLASTLASGAFGLVAVSEICGRFLFYAMQVRVGI